jgi:predicted lipoprotein
MQRFGLILAFLFATGGLLWLFPLFHIVRLDGGEHATGQTTFNAADFAQSFWTDQLTPWLNRPWDNSEQFFAEYRRSPQAAREKHGRKVGVSRSRLFVLRGSGTIASVDSKGVVVKLDHDGGDTEIILQTGLLFGNTVRDATGLLDASDFPNSQHFNAVSTELNRLVETNVIAKLKELVSPGRKIQFVGCAQLSDAAATRPLKIIPLQVQVE